MFRTEEETYFLRMCRKFRVGLHKGRTEPRGEGIGSPTRTDGSTENMQCPYQLYMRRLRLSRDGRDVGGTSTCDVQRLGVYDPSIVVG